MTSLKYSRAHSYSHPGDEEPRILRTDYLCSASHVPAGFWKCGVDDGQGFLPDGDPVSDTVAVKELLGVESAKPLHLDLTRRSLQQVGPTVILPQCDPFAPTLLAHGQWGI